MKIRLSLVRLLEALYEGMRSTVRVRGDLTVWFLIGIGVMQECLLSSLLFNILLEVVTALTLEGNNSGAHISRMCILIFVLLMISA